MPVAKRPGYYVEGRHFRDNYHQALARANFLAEEYGRTIDVSYLAPEDCGHGNTAEPYVVTTVGIPSVARKMLTDGHRIDMPPGGEVFASKSAFIESLAKDWPLVRAEWPDATFPDLRGFLVPKENDDGR